MTKADFKKLAKAIVRANKVQSTEDGRRAIFHVASCIAADFENTNFLGQVAELIVGVDD